MHCVAMLEPAGADALTGAVAIAPFEPSIVAVAISPATSPTTVFARLSAWICDMMGVAGVVLSLLQAVTPRARATAVPSASSDERTVRMAYPPGSHGRYGRVTSVGLGRAGSQCC